MTEREREREGRRRRGGEERRGGRRGEEERQEERERKRRKRDIGHPPLVCDTTLCIIQRTKTTIHTPTLTHLFPLFLPPLSSSFLLFPPLSSSSSSFLLPRCPVKNNVDVRTPALGLTRTATHTSATGGAYIHDGGRGKGKWFASFDAAIPVTGW
jgi:hypothetical protein